MNKTRLNYALDALIGLAFLLSTLTGLVFMVAGSGGYQGGANEVFRTSILGISRWVWSDLHTLTSLVMIGGVTLHLVLHWKWIVCVTKRMVADVKPRKKEEACPVIQQ